MSYIVLAFPVCTLCLDNADGDGWVMSAAWRMVAFQKDILYGELAFGRRTTGRTHLRYKDVGVGYMKAVDIHAMSWESLAADRTKWRGALKQHINTWEDKLMNEWSSRQASTQTVSKFGHFRSLHDAPVHTAA